MKQLVQLRKKPEKLQAWTRLEPMTARLRCTLQWSHLASGDPFLESPEISGVTIPTERTSQSFCFLLPWKHVKRPAFQNKRLAVSQTVFRARNVFVTFEKRPLVTCKLVLYPVIDRMHKWQPKKYSFVYVLIRLTRVALKQHFFCILYMQTRLVSLIST